MVIAKQSHTVVGRCSLLGHLLTVPAEDPIVSLGEALWCRLEDVAFGNAS